MKMKNKYLLITLSLISLIFLIEIASAQFVYQQGEIIDLKIPCFMNDTYCDANVYCNITILKPNTETLVDNKLMTRQSSYYNYTLTSANDTGIYQGTMVCKSATLNGKSSFDFKITPSGEDLTTAQGGLAIGLLLSIVGLAFFFGLIAMKLIDYDNLFPIALFFMILAIIISVYALYLGVVYARDYIISSATSGPQNKIFISILYGFTGISLIGMVFFTLKVLGEIKERKTQKRYGAGYNTRTKTYD